MAKLKNAAAEQRPPRDRCHKAMFASSFSGRHCMVLADSFYEWKTVGTHKKSYRIMLKSGEPFAMAGIYAHDDDAAHGPKTAEKWPVRFAILTTAANELMQPIHERMSVILPLGREKNWLPPNPSGMFVFPEFPSELMTAYPVSPKMNKARYNDYGHDGDHGIEHAKGSNLRRRYKKEKNLCEQTRASNPIGDRPGDVTFRLKGRAEPEESDCSDGAAKRHQYAERFFGMRVVWGGPPLTVLDATTIERLA
jgi:hypothetical protein